MGYIDRNLLPDETILFRTRKSQILFFYPMIITIFSIICSQYMQQNPILDKVLFVPWLLTTLFWGFALLEYYSSDYAVTNKRIMMREGFFNRHANEMRLSAISQVNVDQNLIGQVLNFGVVSINAFGAFDVYAGIARPFEFQQAVNHQLDRVAR